MFGKVRSRQWFLSAVLLAAVEAVCLVTIAAPAQAQFDAPYRRRSSPGFFQNWFGPTRPPGEIAPRTHAPNEHFESSRAPLPHKPDPSVNIATSIVVMGDGMADWLAYGLEDAFSDTPEVGIVRENKFNSGLLRYDAKSELDWWHVARDVLAKSKANYVVMMLGVTDRQPIRERDVAKPDKEPSKDAKTEPDAAKKNQNEDAEQGTIIAPEPKATRAAGSIEFRSDRWAEVYSRRIDETIAALKSKGVPVFWVGLPSIRGTRSTSEASYLNELYRARAERAGAIYIDVWDGFVDEGGKYSNYGPDYEGQIRRLRSSDGVFFTKYGARKLAHYVEREIRRYMTNRAAPVALPAAPLAPAPGAALPKSTVRPLAGPVVPLTVPPGNTDELAGSANPQPALGDATASQVLVRGDAVNAPANRADDFAWPQGNDAAKAPPPGAAAPPVAPPPPVESKAPPPKSEPTEKTVQANERKPPKPVKPQVKPRPRQDDDAPRPPRPLGWLR